MSDFNILVIQERISQEAKWGIQNHSLKEWCIILMEEMGELAAASLERQWPDNTSLAEHTQEEIVRVAAVCQAIYESGKRCDWL